MNLLKQHRVGIALLGAALLLFATQGCGDSKNDNVAPPVNGGTKSTGGSSGRGGSSGKTGSSSDGGKSGNATAGAADDGGGSSESGGGGTGGTSSNQAGSGNEGGGDNPPIPECDKPELGADGCFNCPKDKEVEQWLNRCTDGDCVPFDNKARLPKLKADGSLPPLPT
jgi:hypothetical protein